jgi:hypothetical protein
MIGQECSSESEERGECVIDEPVTGTGNEALQQGDETTETGREPAAAPADSATSAGRKPALP